MRKLTALVATTLLLTGCIQAPDRKAMLDQLIGQPETVVARVMGVPDRTFDAEGHRFLAYVEHRIETFPGYDMLDGYGRYGTLGYRRLGFEAAPELYARRCETTFEVADKKVLAYTLRGNACG